MKNVIIVTVIGFLAVSGFNFSKHRVTISGETASVTLLSLGAQASAYCNEATFAAEVNNGNCSGAANDMSTVCNAIGNGSGNCTTHHY